MLGMAMYFQWILKFAVTNGTILANKYSKIKIYITSLQLCLGGKDVVICIYEIREYDKSVTNPD